jgi:YhcH/YjgK/YiaL family protein
MIVGHFNNLAKDAKYYSPLLEKGLKFLQTADFSLLQDGRIDIDGDNLYGTISEYLPESKENRKAESHEKYIDIQYIIAGEEIIGYGNLDDSAEISENRLAERDAIFYKTINMESNITLYQGMYAIFFPWDIHRPCCVLNAGRKVRKLVLKIKV